MKYVIMCGGKYEKWKEPKHLQVINGEPIVVRTIRLLRENGINDIVITATDKRFDNLGVPRIEHKNTFELTKNGQKGYWLDAFYNFGEPVVYIFGDVYFSVNAIRKIVNYKGGGNVLFGSKLATNKLKKNWGEPFAYVVNDYETFFNGIAAVKKLQDEGKTDRMPVSWELYRYLNGLDVNVHEVRPETFIVIDDITDDVDHPEGYKKLKEKAENVIGNAFFFSTISSIGGTETFLYYLAKKYKDRDIAIYCRYCNDEQRARLEKYVPVKIINGEPIRCKKAFFNYSLDGIQFVEADEYVQVIHADYKNQGIVPKTDEKLNRYIAVSQTVADSFKELTNIECEICPNPLLLDDERPLILMSATRLTKEKGKERIEKLAKILDSNEVNFRWLIFTNDTEVIKHKNIVFMPPDMDVTTLMPICDYFVQLSDCEGYCFSVNEANAQGIPCIMTDLPVFKENGNKGIYVDLDLNDVPIDKLKKGARIKYTPPKDRWNEILTDDKSTYEPPKDTDYVDIQINCKYFDYVLNRHVNSGETITVMRSRAKEMKARGVLFDIVR